eukprot:scaffold10269_cov102-Isochrysis_galbana.AAC.13
MDGMEPGRGGEGEGVHAWGRGLEPGRGGWVARSGVEGCKLDMDGWIGGMGQHQSDREGALLQELARRRRSAGAGG